MERYSLLSLPLPVFKGNDSKNMKLVEYKEKLVVTYFDGEKNSRNYRSWRIILETNETRGIT